eukprot:Gregarina_sp_Poly_1__8387@NODE_491_length_7964_cov_12_375332_g395_i0_p7_GENE_NODE_491_length_7964_cov_12_375332_g395_i0NODE_491_length_7964_cov_12_375332_g395_i0_p7_ORF_typecomplete_len117_score11_11_NODE_491_length_7964_cov_12_375332_g395_i032973647
MEDVGAKLDEMLSKAEENLARIRELYPDSDVTEELVTFRTLELSFYARQALNQNSQLSKVSHDDPIILARVEGLVDLLSANANNRSMTPLVIGNLTLEAFRLYSRSAPVFVCRFVF